MKIFRAAMIALACYSIGVAQQNPAAYTAAQATAGRATYQANCAGCHGADLSGLNSASALAGGLFMSSWGDRTSERLVAFLEGAMPPGNPGSLGEQAYVDVAAFILEFNGAQSGNQPLTAASESGHPFGGNGPGGQTAGRRRPWRTARWPAKRRFRRHPGSDGRRRSEELHAGHRRHAAQSRSQRLADDPPRLSRQQLQPAESDHHAEREGSAAAVGLGHERRNQSARAAWCTTA